MINIILECALRWLIQVCSMTKNEYGKKSVDPYLELDKSSHTKRSYPAIQLRWLRPLIVGVSGRREEAGIKRDICFWNEKEIHTAVSQTSVAYRSIWVVVRSSLQAEIMTDLDEVEARSRNPWMLDWLANARRIRGKREGRGSNSEGVGIDADSFLMSPPRENGVKHGNHRMTWNLPGVQTFPLPSL